MFLYEIDPRLFLSFNSNSGVNNSPMHCFNFLSSTLSSLHFALCHPSNSQDLQDVGGLKEKLPNSKNAHFDPGKTEQTKIIMKGVRFKIIAAGDVRQRGKSKP